VNITGVQKGHYFGKHHKCEEIIAMRVESAALCELKCMRDAPSIRIIPQL